MHKKRKSRIRYGRIIVFLILVLLGIAVLGFLGITGYHAYESRFSAAAKAGTTDYYLIVGVNNADKPVADTIILGTVNEKGQEMSLISIPANTIVGRNEKEKMLLRDVYTQGGIEETKSSLENLLHVRIGHFVIMNTSTMEALLNHFDPVDMYIEKDMSHTDENGNPDISLNRGYQTLDSHAAMSYVRYLDDDKDEIARIQRSQRYMKTFFTMFQKNYSIFNWAVVKTWWAPYYSDITGPEAGNIAYNLTDYKQDNCHLFILPGELKVQDNLKGWVMNPTETQKVIATTINQ